MRQVLDTYGIAPAAIRHPKGGEFSKWSALFAPARAINRIGTAESGTGQNSVPVLLVPRHVLLTHHDSQASEQCPLQ
jgi:hypothetical protein